MDFVLKGTSKDYLNVTDILSGFDTGVDNINNFVRLTYVSSSRTDLKINADGAGDDWVTVANLNGSSFTGTTVDMMLAGGQIITNQSLV